MKPTLFVLFGLVAVFNAVTVESAGGLASEIQEEVAKNGLKCDQSQINNYCASSGGQPVILGGICPILLNAYLCENQIAEEDLKNVLEAFRDYQV